MIGIGQIMGLTYQDAMTVGDPNISEGHAGHQASSGHHWRSRYKNNAALAFVINIRWQSVLIVRSLNGCLCLLCWVILEEVDCVPQDVMMPSFYRLRLSLLLLVVEVSTK